MRTRIAVALVSALLLLPASPALAQLGSNPFDNITPEPSATPTPTADTSTDTTGRDTLYVIGAALVVAFAGIGIWIARDARRNLPEELREDRPRDKGPHKHQMQAKSKARAKGRAQRQARKAGRKAKR
jgi:hypothetical protein